MSETPLDLRQTFQALRRRRIIVLVTAAASLAISVALAVRAPTSFIAKSGVLLPPSALDSSGKPLRNIGTEVQIAASSTVLSRAGQTLQPPASVRTLRKAIRVRALSPDIIQIRVDWTSPRGAAVVANAVAKQYVEYAAGATTSEADVQTTALRDQAADLDRKIRQLESDIASATARLSSLDQRTAEAQRQSALLDSMRVSQVEASRELSTLNTRIAEVQLDASLAQRGIRILEPAIPPSGPSRKSQITTVAVGGFLGLLVGVILALVRDRGDRRLRTRDDIADAAGAPVLLSMPVAHRIDDRQCRRLYRDWQPNATDRYALSQAMARVGILSSQRTSNILLVALPDDKAAALFGLHLAIFLADRGQSTALIFASEDRTSAVIRAACKTESMTDRGARRDLEVYGLDDLHERHLASSQVSVTLITDPKPALWLPTWGRPTITTLVASSGVATGEELASVAVSLFDAGHPVNGVYVINPDVQDRTTGRSITPLRSPSHIARDEGTHKGLNPPVPAPGLPADRKP